jgi:hypothetical protein
MHGEMLRGVSCAVCQLVARGLLNEDRLQFFDNAGVLAWVVKMREKAKELQDNVVRGNERCILWQSVLLL